CALQVDQPVALVVMGVARRAPGPQRERRLRALQRLDRGFLIHAEYDDVLGRVEVEAHDVTYLRGELRVAAHLVGAHMMRLEPVAAQHIRHTAAGDMDFPGEEAGGPAAPSRRPGPEGGPRN